MDRLKLVEVIAAEIRKFGSDPAGAGRYPDEGQDLAGHMAGYLADAIIREIGLRSLRTPTEGRDDPEGGTMPPGPWSGSA